MTMEFTRRLAHIAFLIWGCASFCAGAGRPDPGSRGVDWSAVKEKVASEPWAMKAVVQLRNEVAETRRLFPEPPFGRAGWAHDYYCDKDAGKLQFNPATPLDHACPKCGTHYTDKRRNEAWIDLAYKRIYAAVRDAAVLYRLNGDRDAFDYGRRTLLWFTDNLARFEVHGDHAGKGRITGQSLCEATLMVSFAIACWDLWPGLSPDDREKIVSGLFLPSAELIHRQTGTIHNIHSWHNSAVGLIGLVSGEKAWVEKAVNGPFGLKQQIAKGVKEDGFWYEGSIGYHFYTISSIIDFYTALRARGWDMAGTERFQKMLLAPLDFAFSNLEMPSLNDGWRGRLDRCGSYYEQAAGLWPDVPRLREPLSSMRRREAPEAAALLFGPAKPPAPAAPDRPSVLFRDSGLAVLRDGGVEALLKFSPYGGGHDHRDQLNLVLFAAGQQILPDLGTSGYGIGLNSWYRSPAAHNVLVVDGGSQKPSDGFLVDYSPNRVEGGADKAYAGVQLRRALSIGGGVVTDRVSAVSNGEHVYDLFYHVAGTLESCTVARKPQAGFAQKNGYDRLARIESGTAAGEASFVFRLRDGKTRFAIRSKADTPFEIFTGVCPDNPADEELAFVLFRAKGSAAAWTSFLNLAAGSLPVKAGSPDDTRK